jgi:hypothetical protein
MKSLYNNLLKFFMIFALIVISVTGCDENKILEEKPLDFLTPTNAYTTPDGIEQGIVGLYTGIRDKWTYQLISEQPYALYGLGTDVGYDGETPGGQRFLTNYKTSVTPEYNIINTWWRTLYNQIQRANMILRDIENIDEGLWRDVAQKNSYIAEARFLGLGVIDWL